MDRPERGNSTWIRVVAAVAATVVLAISAAPASAQARTWSIHDGTNELGSHRTSLERDLAAMAERGWHLHLRHVPGTGPVSGQVEPAIPVGATEKITDGTLALVINEASPRQWVIVGAGGEEPTGAGALILPEVTEQFTAKMAQRPAVPSGIFVLVVADVAGVDLSEAGASSGGDGSEGGNLLGFPVVLLGVYLVLRGLWRRHRLQGEPEAVLPVGQVQPGQVVLVSGEAQCEQPLWVQEAGVAAIYAESIVQRMRTKFETETRDVKWQGAPGDTWIEKEYYSVEREAGFKDTRRKERQVVPFRVADGSGAIWVDPGSFVFKGRSLWVGPRSGDTRTVVNGIPLGTVSVKGMVHVAPDGSRYLGQRADRRMSVVESGEAGGLVARPQRALRMGLLFGLPLIVVGYVITYV